MLCGNDIRNCRPTVACALASAKFQNANIFETLTVAQCLRIAGTLIERPSLVRRSATLALPPYALEVISRDEPRAQLGAVAKDLSHGEQQALELAMVLALEPRIVLLDEADRGPHENRAYADRQRCPRRSLTGTVVLPAGRARPISSRASPRVSWCCIRGAS